MYLVNSYCNLFIENTEGFPTANLNLYLCNLGVGSGMRMYVKGGGGLIPNFTPAHNVLPLQILNKQGVAVLPLYLRGPGYPINSWIPMFIKANPQAWMQLLIPNVTTPWNNPNAFLSLYLEAGKDKVVGPSLFIHGSDKARAHMSLVISSIFPNSYLPLFIKASGNPMTSPCLSLLIPHTIDFTKTSIPLYTHGY